MKLVAILIVTFIMGCSGGIGGPPEPPCGDKLKNWDGDNSPCMPGFVVCPPKKRCLFDPSTGLFTVVADEDSLQ